MEVLPSSKTNYPLTRSQELLWTSQKMFPKVPLNNVPYVFEISGEINVLLFQKAFRELVNKVDILRTVFTEADGVPSQSVLETWNYDLELHNFERASRTEIDNWLHELAKKEFDFSKPLFDSSYYRISEAKHIWFLNLHHLVTDATTSLLLYQKMSAIYKSLIEEKEFPQPNTTPYSEFVDFELNNRLQENTKSLQNYWKEKVKSLPERKTLYGVNSRQTTTETERVSLVLDTDMVKKLKASFASSKMSLLTEEFSILSVFATLISTYVFRLAGQKTVVIGLPLHNRTSKRFKETPGLLIEVLPLTVDIEEEDTFKSLFKKVKSSAANLMKNSDFGVASGEASRPINYIFNYITTTFTEFAGMPSHVSWIHPGHCDRSHHMRCHLYDFNGTGNWELVFDLNKDIFNKERVANVKAQFLGLLTSFIREIENSIYQPSLISKTETQSYLSGFEQISLKKDDNHIINLFETVAELQASKVALQQGTLLYTYKTLEEKVNQLANYLIREGIGPSKRVALHLSRSPEYVISTLAIMKIGATFIPIPANQTASRIKYILEDSESVLILTEEKLIKNIAGSIPPYIDIKSVRHKVKEEAIESPGIERNNGLAYILYTSGSTGNPKGVCISHNALYNYLDWAGAYYGITKESVFPLFTSIGFDLTITSTFLPLLNGGHLVIYKESGMGVDMALFQVLAENITNIIKLTPSHLSLLKDRNLSKSALKKIIVGGEDFKTELAKSIHNALDSNIEIYNEYGPTEATVGCVVTKFNPAKHTDISVPIGESINNMAPLVLDSYLNLVPKGVTGELYMSGLGLADGYLKLDELTEQKFLPNPFFENQKMYRTGDLVRYNENNELEYLGRADEQIKLRGYRIELPDIEANMVSHPKIENSAVMVVEGKKRVAEEDIVNCAKCGLPSNYPTADFDTNGVCHICNSFKDYKHKVDHYFKTEDDLKALLTSVKGKNPEYDCLSLLSGGKDSTYILAQLVNMGMKVLAFTLDNGYISDQAKANIQRVVDKLGVDHMYGATEHMNKIFVDSLERHKNVCDGCFKTIYTLSTNLALEKQIPFIVTGLSRGQFFETRLTEELFWNTDIEAKQIDDTILEARKLYHQENDAIRKLLDVSAFDDNSTFEKVQFVDFYRYNDVSLEEMIKFLEEKIDWKRPTDTGRSTNCLINQLGIYVHKKQKGYSNYSFPYSWDVRLGHKTRQETLDEINEYINEKEVLRMMDEIGYTEPVENEMDMQRLVGYYTGPSQIPANELKLHLKTELPDYMIPTHFKYVEEFPLTLNGKVDKASLKKLSLAQLDMESAYVKPSGEIEEILAKIWCEVLKLKQVGAQDNFISLGGHSLAAIRVSARAKEEFELDVPLNKVFEFPTISSYAKHVEETIMDLMNQA
ncbi:MAG: amino acid adenylation domain-containing protein [Bacteroidota bacterium]